MTDAPVTPAMALAKHYAEIAVAVHAQPRPVPVAAVTEAHAAPGTEDDA